MRKASSLPYNWQHNRVMYVFLWGALGLVLIYGLQLLFPHITTLFRLQQDVLFSQPWRLVTSMFLHGSTSHLLSNLIGFVLFGLVLESVMGSRKATYYALGTGIGASVIAGFFYPSAVGASGLIFGLIGMLMVLRPFAPAFAFGVPLPMFLAGIGWGVANIGGLFIESSTGYIAHLAGLGIGVVIGVVTHKTYGKPLFGKKSKPLLSEEEFTNWEKRYMR